MLYSCTHMATVGVKDVEGFYVGQPKLADTSNVLENVNLICHRYSLSCSVFKLIAATPSRLSLLT